MPRRDYSVWDAEENYAGYLRMSIEQQLKRGDDTEIAKRVRDKLRFDHSLALRVAADAGLPLDVLIAYRDRLRDLSPKALARLAVALAIYE